LPDHRFSSDRAGLNDPYSSQTPTTIPTPATPTVESAVDVVVAGSLAIDLSCDLIPQNGMAASKQPQLNTSNPAFIRQDLGGVGQNVATALHLLNTSVRLCSSVAHDVAGSTAVEILVKQGFQTAGIHRSTGKHRTAQYVAINDAQKNLVLGMADMTILEDITEDFDTLWKSHLDTCKPKWLVVDANWHPLTLHKWLDAAKAAGAKVAYEPVSVTKAKRLFLKNARDNATLAAVPHHVVNLATPNAQELASMHQAATSAGAFERGDWWSVIDSIGLSSSGSRDKLVSMTNSALVDLGVPQQSIQLSPFVPCMLTTLGEQGVLLTQLLQPGDNRLTSPDSAPYVLSRSTNGSEVVGGVYMRLFPPVENISKENIVSVNGVGDTFLGVLIAGLSKQNPKEVADLVGIAQSGSIMTLKSREAVSPEVSGLQSLL
jgi:pseudouridine-5'-phosphate glycosidase/pseudouridine kinase